MPLNEKDREEIRKTIAELLAGSIFSRVEHIITDGLSAKVGHIQQAQAEAEAKTAETRKEEAGLRERIVQAEHQLAQLRAAIKVDQQVQEKAAKERGAKLKALDQKLKDRQDLLDQQLFADQETIKSSREQTELALLEHKRAIDQIQQERVKLEKGHEEYRRSVGL